MVNWANWGAAVPIIVAIIGVSGFATFSSVFINQIYNRPTINIDIEPKPENGKQIINITNGGTIPATNLSLVLTANNHIINNITNLLSTANVFLVNPGPSSLLEMNHPKPINGLVLDLHINKFVNGDGSIIRLAAGTKNTTAKDFVVYATYDQGSISMSIGKLRYPPIFYLAFAAELIAGFYILYRLFKWRKRHDKYTYY